MKSLVVSLIALTAISVQAEDDNRYTQAPRVAAEQTNSQLSAKTRSEIAIASRNAAIKADLHFACSKKGRQETNALINDLGQSIYNIEAASKEITGNDPQAAKESIVATYEAMFDCERIIEKALTAGITEVEIEEAINKTTSE